MQHCGGLVVALKKMLTENCLFQTFFYPSIVEVFSFSFFSCELQSALRLIPSEDYALFAAPCSVRIVLFEKVHLHLE
jgi:hypothetical protein